MILTVNGNDISSMVGNITLNSSLDTLGDQLDFEIAYSTMYYYSKLAVNTGDIVILSNEKQIFQGIVVTKTRNEKTQAFSCFDFAFYLNKSKTIKQFNNMRADVAIKTLLAEFEVPIGSIAEMPTLIRKIYYDKEVAEVIRNIIQEVTNVTGTKFVMEMNEGQFYIYRDTDLTLNLKIKIADNLPKVDINETISNSSKKASIEEMKNSIKLYVGNEERVKTFVEKKSNVMIDRYGLLQETRSLQDKDIAQARNIADNMLNELGRVIVDGSIEVLGHFDLRAGRIIVLNEPITNLVGKYKIKSANHSIGKIHTTSLQLEEVQDGFYN